MSLPTAREVFKKYYDPNETAFDSTEEYIYYLERQHKELLYALCGISDEITNTARLQDWHSQLFRDRFEAVVIAVANATFLSLDDAVKMIEEK